MKDFERLDEIEREKSRRRFLKRAGLAVATAPAVAVLMSAGAKHAEAGRPTVAISGESQPLPCWVAREVYGFDNPRWLQFRTWLLGDAPAWFRRLYFRHGARFATWISDKPMLKRAIRSWMDSRIASAA